MAKKATLATHKKLKAVARASKIRYSRRRYGATQDQRKSILTDVSCAIQDDAPQSTVELDALVAQCRDVLHVAGYVSNQNLPRSYTKNQIALAKLIVGALSGSAGVAAVVEQLKAPSRQVRSKPVASWKGRVVVPVKLPITAEPHENLFFCRSCRIADRLRVVFVDRIGSYAEPDLVNGVPAMGQYDPMGGAGGPHAQELFRLATAQEIAQCEQYLRDAWMLMPQLIPGDAYRLTRPVAVGMRIFEKGTTVVFVPDALHVGDSYAPRVTSKIPPLERPFLTACKGKKVSTGQEFWTSYPVAHVIDCYSQTEFLCDPRYMEHIVPDQSLVDRLVLPPCSSRELNQALHRQSLGASQVYEQWGMNKSAHKGKGLVVLCQGPPGTGKTLTAEAIAARLRRPLLKIQAWSNQDENFLQRVCSTAERWKLVVLMDEAEAFLCHRDAGSMQQNSLVATMLRQMENFAGILVLTTNREIELDPAARSRVHLTLTYSLPGAELRRQIWTRAVPPELPLDAPTEEWLDPVSQLALNGRQINHAVLSAASRASFEGLDVVPSSYLLDAAQAELAATKPSNGKAGFAAYRTAEA